MKSTQSDHNMNFDGMEAIAPKHSTKFSGNQSGLKFKENAGRGPTKGNHGTTTPGSCHPPVSAVPGLPAQGSTRDNINRGGQVRTPGGTRAFDPKATQNYRGNADAINAGRGPTKGNSC